jgi:hypothetical protein
LVQDWSRQAKSPAIVPIKGPLFITGMPRSGSTFLHELLAQDPANRMPRVWEVMFPLPAPAKGPNPRDPRIRRAAACLWWFRRLAPQADSVHPIRAGTPQECVAIHSYTLLSEEFIATCHVPAYESFLHATDLGPTYAWQKRFLQHLQAESPNQRWVLKSPDHVYGLASLFSVFPDAVVVQTHRNPVDVLKSSLRLVEVLQRVFARPRSRQQIGLRETRSLADATERFIRFREDHPGLAGRFIDVKYLDLVADPLAIVRGIYCQLGLPLSEPAAEAMRRFVATRSRYPKPRKVHSLADLGIDPSAEGRRFQQYCSRFGISGHQPRPG